MRVAIVNETFTEKMGYTENHLARCYACLGHEVHVISANLQAYHSLPDYKETYEPFLGPAVQPCGTKQLNGFALHRLPYSKLLGYVRIPGLIAALRELRPDVVQTLAAASWLPLDAARARPALRYRLFTGAHQNASVMDPALMAARRWSTRRLRSDMRRALPGRFVSRHAIKCYATTPDCAEVARRFYGVPTDKLEICPLGVDTDGFYPVRDDESAAARQALRARFGLAPGEVVCIYTGRFTAAKNPLCLAHAIGHLTASGLPYRGLFVGDGVQATSIAAQDGCVVTPFVPCGELPDFYRAADVGVWPAQDSMSMLDAAACGLPIVVSDRVAATERVEGNGLMYPEGEAGALAASLLKLDDVTVRGELGAIGADKIRTRFSWMAIAKRRLADYENGAH